MRELLTRRNPFLHILLTLRSHSFSSSEYVALKKSLQITSVDLVYCFSLEKFFFEKIEGQKAQNLSNLITDLELKDSNFEKNSTDFDSMCGKALYELILKFLRVTKYRNTEMRVVLDMVGVFVRAFATRLRQDLDFCKLQVERDKREKLQKMDGRNSDRVTEGVLQTDNRLLCLNLFKNKIIPIICNQLITLATQTLALLYENDPFITQTLCSHFTVLHDVLNVWFGTIEEVQNEITVLEKEILPKEGIRTVFSNDIATDIMKKCFIELFIALNLKNRELTAHVKPLFVQMVRYLPLKEIYFKKRMYMEVADGLLIDNNTSDCQKYKNLVRENEIQKTIPGLNTFLYFSYSLTDPTYLLSLHFNPFAIQRFRPELIFYEQIFFYFLYFDSKFYLKDIGNAAFRSLLRMEDGLNILIDKYLSEDFNILNERSDLSKQNLLNEENEQIQSHLSDNLNTKNAKTEHCCSQMALMARSHSLKLSFQQAIENFNKTGKMTLKYAHLVLRAFPSNLRVLGKTLGRREEPSKNSKPSPKKNEQNTDIMSDKVTKDFITQQNLPQAAFQRNNSNESIPSSILYTDSQDLGHEQPSFLVRYLNTFDFCDLPLLVALRSFLNCFVMPSESQQIERILEAFSYRYWECRSQNNSDVVPSKIEANIKNFQQPVTSNVAQKIKNANDMSLDTINILTLMIIVLNTEIHSPHAKGMSRLVFIERVRECFKPNDKKDSASTQPNNLSDKYIASLYDDIKTNPLKPNDIFLYEKESYECFMEYVKKINREMYNFDNTFEKYQAEKSGSSEKSDHVVLVDSFDFLPIDRFKTCLKCKKQILSILISQNLSIFKDSSLYKNISTFSAKNDSKFATIKAQFPLLKTILFTENKILQSVLVCSLTERVLQKEMTLGEYVVFIENFVELTCQKNESNERFDESFDKIIKEKILSGLDFILSNFSLKEDLRNDLNREEEISGNKNSPKNVEDCFYFTYVLILLNMKKKNESFFLKRNSENDKMKEKLFKTFANFGIGLSIVQVVMKNVSSKLLQEEKIEPKQKAKHQSKPEQRDGNQSKNSFFTITSSLKVKIIKDLQQIFKFSVRNKNLNLIKIDQEVVKEVVDSSILIEMINSIQNHTEKPEQIENQRILFNDLIKIVTEKTFEDVLINKKDFFSVKDSVLMKSDFSSDSSESTLIDKNTLLECISKRPFVFISLSDSIDLFYFLHFHSLYIESESKNTETSSEINTPGINLITYFMKSKKYFEARLESLFHENAVQSTSEQNTQEESLNDPKIDFAALKTSKFGQFYQFKMYHDKLVFVLTLLECLYTSDKKVFYQVNYLKLAQIYEYIRNKYQKGDTKEIEGQNKISESDLKSLIPDDDILKESGDSLKELLKKVPDLTQSRSTSLQLVIKQLMEAYSKCWSSMVLMMYLIDEFKLQEPEIQAEETLQKTEKDQIWSERLVKYVNQVWECAGWKDENVCTKSVKLAEKIKEPSVEKESVNLTDEIEEEQKIEEQFEI